MNPYGFALNYCGRCGAQLAPDDFDGICSECDALSDEPDPDYFWDDPREVLILPDKDPRLPFDLWLLERAVLTLPPAKPPYYDATQWTFYREFLKRWKKEVVREGLHRGVKAEKWSPTRRPTWLDFIGTIRPLPGSAPSRVDLSLLRSGGSGAAAPPSDPPAGPPAG